MSLDDWYYTAADVLDLVAACGILSAVSVLAPEGIAPEYPGLRSAWALTRSHVLEGSTTPLFSSLQNELDKVKML